MQREDRASGEYYPKLTVEIWNSSSKSSGDIIASHTRCKHTGYAASAMGKPALATPDHETSLMARWTMGLPAEISLIFVTGGCQSSPKISGDGQEKTSSGQECKTNRYTRKPSNLASPKVTYWNFAVGQRVKVPSPETLIATG